MKKLLYISILLSVLSCKNEIKSSQEKDKYENGISTNFEEDSNIQTSHESDNQARQSVNEDFVTEKLDFENDSVLISQLVEKNIKEYQEGLEDDSPWKDMEPFDLENSTVIYSKDSILKVVNLYGEYPGAMIHSPFYKKYVIKDSIIFPLTLHGKAYRIDTISTSKNQYRFYLKSYIDEENNIEVFDAVINQNSLKISMANNYLFYLIRNKKEIPDSLPKRPENLERLSEEAITRLKLNPKNIKGNEKYLLEEKTFLTANVEKLDLQLYYYSVYGNYLAKILRIGRVDSTSGIVLSSINSNGLDTETISTEFINDSIFVENRVFEKTLKDDTEMMEYAYDSIVTKYHYDSELNFRQISKDTFNYNIEVITKPKTSWKNLKIYSNPFTFQGEECVWEFLVTHYNTLGKKNEYVCFRKNIVQLKTGRRMLAYENQNVDPCASIRDLFVKGSPPQLQDLNFDGYGDLSFYNNVASGSGGAFFDNYIYNPKKEIFEYSEKLSGGGSTLDTINKTLSFYWKMGIPWNAVRTLHFDGKGNIKFEDNVIREIIYLDSTDLMVKTYKKLIDDKIVEQSVDTTKFEGY